MDPGKYRNWARKLKCTNREYHVQEKKITAAFISENVMCYKSVTGIAIFGPHAKPHGVRGLSKHYHF